jgi:8-oxo-dGTP pyrophosphatase MutT (NUDIX family)
MYTIYINEIECQLVSSHEFLNLKESLNANVLTSSYTGKSKNLLNIVDMCEKSSKYEKVIVHFHDSKILIEDFESLFIIQEAAGGLVANQDQKYLFIFRRNFWDLPKGKMEKNESVEETSIREVEEETGITNIKLGDPICTTLHTFVDRKKRRIIKRSHWFAMTTMNQDLIPQTEEDIEKAEWIDLDTFRSKCTPVYKNILHVLDTYESMKSN